MQQEQRPQEHESGKDAKLLPESQEAPSAPHGGKPGAFEKKQAVPNPVPPPSPMPSFSSKQQQVARPSNRSPKPSLQQKASMEKSKDSEKPANLRISHHQQQQQQQQTRQQQQQQSHADKIPTYNEMKRQMQEQKKGEEEEEKRNRDRPPMEKTESSSILERLTMKMLAPNIGPLRSPPPPALAPAMVLQAAERFRRDPRKRPVAPPPPPTPRLSMTPPPTPRYEEGSPSPSQCTEKAAAVSGRIRDPRLERRLSQDSTTSFKESGEKVMTPPPPQPQPQPQLQSQPPTPSPTQVPPSTILPKPKGEMPSATNLFSSTQGLEKVAGTKTTRPAITEPPSSPHRPLPTAAPKETSQDPLEGLLVRSKASSSWKRTKCEKADGGKTSDTSAPGKYHDSNSGKSADVGGSSSKKKAGPVYLVRESSKEDTESFGAALESAGASSVDLGIIRKRAAKRRRISSSEEEEEKVVAVALTAASALAAEMVTEVEETEVVTTTEMSNKKQKLGAKSTKPLRVSKQDKLEEKTGASAIQKKKRPGKRQKEKRKDRRNEKKAEKPRKSRKSSGKRRKESEAKKARLKAQALERAFCWKKGKKEEEERRIKKKRKKRETEETDVVSPGAQRSSSIDSGEDEEASPKRKRARRTPMVLADEEESGGTESNQKKADSNAVGGGNKKRKPKIGPKSVMMSLRRKEEEEETNSTLKPVVWLKKLRPEDIVANKAKEEEKEEDKVEKGESGGLDSPENSNANANDDSGSSLVEQEIDARLQKLTKRKEVRAAKKPWERWQAAVPSKRMTTTAKRSSKKTRVPSTDSVSSLSSSSSSSGKIEEKSPDKTTKSTGELPRKTEEEKEPEDHDDSDDKGNGEDAPAERAVTPIIPHILKASIRTISDTKFTEGAKEEEEEEDREEEEGSVQMEEEDALIELPEEEKAVIEIDRDVDDEEEEVLVSNADGVGGTSGGVLEQEVEDNALPVVLECEVMTEEVVYEETVIITNVDVATVQEEEVVVTEEKEEKEQKEEEEEEQVEEEQEEEEREEEEEDDDDDDEEEGEEQGESQKCEEQSDAASLRLSETISEDGEETPEDEVVESEKDEPVKDKGEKDEPAKDKVERDKDEVHQAKTTVNLAVNERVEVILGERDVGQKDHGASEDAGKVVEYQARVDTKKRTETKKEDMVKLAGEPEPEEIAKVAVKEPTREEEEVVPDGAKAETENKNKNASDKDEASVESREDLMDDINSEIVIAVLEEAVEESSELSQGKGLKAAERQSDKVETPAAASYTEAKTESPIRTPNEKTRILLPAEREQSTNNCDCNDHQPLEEEENVEETEAEDKGSFRSDEVFDDDAGDVAEDDGDDDGELSSPPASPLVLVQGHSASIDFCPGCGAKLDPVEGRYSLNCVTFEVSVTCVECCRLVLIREAFNSRMKRSLMSDACR